MAGDLSCTICYESYVASTDICSTKCGHLFHMSCLQKWITQSNTCPMCNEHYPQPHRIYLDLSGINATSVSNSTQQDDGRDNTIVLKGVKPNQVTSPLFSLIQRLIAVMQVPITENDIKDISKHGRKGLIHVTFKTKNHMDLILKQKHKLKNNSEMSQIRIHELLDSETEALFNYTHKLKNSGYKIIFVANKKVYAKKQQHSVPIHILTRAQVDALCLPQTNNQEIASTSLAQSNNVVRATNNIRAIASTSLAQRNNEVRSTNNIRATASTSMAQRNNEVRSTYTVLSDSDHLCDTNLELYLYSQRLISIGYHISIDNNRVFAKRYGTTTLISSKTKVDQLFGYPEEVRGYEYTGNSVYTRNNQIRNTKSNDNCNIL